MTLKTPSPKALIAIAIAPLALAATACNTVEGAGEDLQSASNTVEEEL